MATKARSKAKQSKGKPKAKARPSGKAAKGAARGPRSQTLPTMGQVRSARLDNYCESIAEDRASMAHAKADEQGSIQGALQEMKKRGLVAYKHAGVELAFVPGADKLRVRLTKDASDSSAAAGDDIGAQAADPEGEEVGGADEGAAVNEDGVPF